MDITQFKINVEKSMKANTLKKSVKETLQKESDERQGLIYRTQEFYEPIIKKPLQSLKDKMIKQLKENQKAITTGLKNIVESNQDIYTLNNELPFTAEPAPQAIEPASKPILDISADFSEADMDFL